MGHAVPSGQDVCEEQETLGGQRRNVGGQGIPPAQYCVEVHASPRVGGIVQTPFAQEPEAQSWFLEV